MSHLASLAVFLLAALAPTDEAALAEIDGRALTRDDLKLYLTLRGVPESASPAFRARATQELIDRELIRRFLERNKIAADDEQLEVAVRTAKERLAAEGKNPDEILASLGVDEAGLKSEIALPLAWRKLVSRAVTDDQIRNRFENHRRRLDGTKLRVAQIFLMYEMGESPKDAPSTTTRLRSVRDQIVAGETSFAEAARSHSQAPTAEAGGEVGWIGPTGDLPASATAAAYTLDEGAVGEVVLSPFGAHLVTVLEIKPGDLSLEDVRPAVIEELSDALWAETVAAERKTAKIVLRQDD